MKAFMGIKNLIDKLEIKINWQNEFLKFISLFEDELQIFNPPAPKTLHSHEEFMGDAIRNGVKPQKLFEFKDEVISKEYDVQII
jgi:hypothetical protein